MRFFLILSFLIAAMPLAAEEPRPRAGLLWKQSELPATLPLQMQSAPGVDHVVFLTRPGAAQPVMAGYVRGGEFFRLLVPPGDWLISIASGHDWQGEEYLFGSETTWTELTEPLNFIAGAATMNGHVLTIGDEDEPSKITVAPRRICGVTAGQPWPDRLEMREVPQLGPLPQKRTGPARMDPRDPLAHDRLTDGRLDPRDPLAHDRLAGGRLDPRDTLAHDRLARRQFDGLGKPAPVKEVEPLNLRRGNLRLRSVLCD